jgi:cell division protein FtsQ
MTTTYDRTEFDGDVEDVEAPRDRRRRTALIVVALVVLAVIGTWLVAFSPVFGVRTIEVQGNQVLSAAQVERAAAIDRGTPLIRLDTDAAARRVEALPVVASAQVRTSFPSTVVITVDERDPVGYVQAHDRTMLVDRTGDQYRVVANPPAGLPRFDVPADADAQTTGGAVATVARALPAKLLARVEVIHALDPSAITLVLTDGRTVEWGSATGAAAKARVLAVLLEQPGTQIDITDPDQPFTR